jgi:hypothetical protein
VPETLTITGLDALQRTLRALGDQAMQGAKVALTREAETIMTTSKREVPVDTGALRASGAVTTPEVSGSAVSVTLGFGGPAVSYAVPVHENLRAHHPVGHAKFLERPLNAARAGLETRLAETLRRVLERGR